MFFSLTQLAEVPFRTKQGEHNHELSRLFFIVYLLNQINQPVIEFSRPERGLGKIAKSLKVSCQFFVVQQRFLIHYIFFIDYEWQRYRAKKRCREFDTIIESGRRRTGGLHRVKIIGGT